MNPSDTPHECPCRTDETNHLVFDRGALSSALIRRLLILAPSNCKLHVRRTKHTTTAPCRTLGQESLLVQNGHGIDKQHARQQQGGQREHE